MNTKVKIFSGTASEYLAAKIAQDYGIPLGKVNVQRFSDGEMQPSYDESVRGCNVFIVQSTFTPADNLMELLLLVDAAKRASANQVVVVSPYFGYARQDRKTLPRVSIGAKLVANLLTAAGADRVMTMDLHAGQIQGFFDIPVDHLDATVVFKSYLQDLNIEHLCIASPDMGGSPRARMYSRELNADLAIIDKHRETANVISSMRIIGSVAGKNVVLVDDMIDTAGTLSKAADLIIAEGALSVRAICTHPVLSTEKAYENIEKSALLELLVTDTIPLRYSSPKVKVLTVSNLFAKAIYKVHNFESISSLF
ncbi:MAG: ribose-phosphate pyrophosphokinase [Bacteroidia bacterium]